MNISFYMQKLNKHLIFERMTNVDSFKVKNVTIVWVYISAPSSRCPRLSVSVCLPSALGYVCIRSNISNEVSRNLKLKDLNTVVIKL